MKHTDNLTKQEIPRLVEKLNLTDGHVFRCWSSSELAIINDAGKLFHEASRLKQPRLEREFIETYFHLTRQWSFTPDVKRLISSSASMNLEIIANVLRMRRQSEDVVYLLEPCFDNIAHIFRRHGLNVAPCTEQAIASENYDDVFPQAQKVTAICVVSPNNPTGWIIPQTAFEKLCAFCARRKIILIVDASFRIYTPPDETYDQFSILSDAGLDYLAIEDTGKVWPTVELKVSVLTISGNLYEEIYGVYTDFILHTSPFSILLLTKLMALSVEDNLKHIHGIVSQNRQMLCASLAGGRLTMDDTGSGSVAWIRCKLVSAQQVVNQLAEKNVFVLPGNYFFWDNIHRERQLGTHHIRVALTRDSEVVKAACRIFESVSHGTAFGRDVR